MIAKVAKQFGTPEKSAFHKRIHLEGRWESYFNRREWLKAQGVLAKLAWRISAWEHPPLDESPHEIQLDAELADALEKFKDAPEPSELHEDGKFFLYNKGLGEKTPGLETTPEQEEYIEAIQQAPATRDNAWARVMEQVDPDKRGDPYEGMMWIYNNMGTRPESLVVEEIPSLGNLCHLKHCQASAANMAEFYKTVFVKALPDKKTLEYNARFNDDGRESLKMIDDFERSLDEEDAA